MTTASVEIQNPDGATESECVIHFHLSREEIPSIIADLEHLMEQEDYPSIKYFSPH